jgi:hypothetical protein
MGEKTPCCSGKHCSCTGAVKTCCGGCVKKGQLVVSTTTKSKRYCSDGKTPVTVEFTPVECKVGASRLVEYVKAVIKDPATKCDSKEFTSTHLPKGGTKAELLGSCGKAPDLVTDLPTKMCKKKKRGIFAIPPAAAGNPTKAPIEIAIPAPTKAPIAPPTRTPGTFAPVPSRLECTIQGDPHVAPLIGGNFDLHHEGVFRVLHQGKVEVQALMKPCGVAYQKKGKTWTGGLSVKCVHAAAIKFEGRKFEYSAATNTLEEIVGGRGTTKLGYEEVGMWEIDSAKNNAIFVWYLDEDYENSMQVTFMRDLHHEAISIFVVINEAVGPKKIYPKAPGLCAGGGQAQLTLPASKVATKGMPVVLRSGGVGRDLGYPCKKCQAGLGFVGAMCNCKEWAIDRNDQLFTKRTKCK